MKRLYLQLWRFSVMISTGSRFFFCKYCLLNTETIGQVRSSKKKKKIQSRKLCTVNSWSVCWGRGCFLVGDIEMFDLIFCVLYFYNKDFMKNRPRRRSAAIHLVCVRCGNCLKWRRRTHHLRVVGVEGLLIQGEFLGAKQVVQLNHLRELRGEINRRAAASAEVRVDTRSHS